MQTRTRWPYASATLVAIFIASCVPVPRKVYSSTQGDKVARISVVQVLPPEEIRIVNIDSFTNAFGLVGAIVETSIENGRNKQLQRHTGDLRTLLAHHLTEVLVGELKKEGFAVSVEARQPSTISATDLSYDYAAVESQSDALLHVWFPNNAEYGSAGYMRYMYTDSYVPRVYVCARLVNTHDHSELYFQVFSYGLDLRVENVEYVPSVPSYEFTSPEELLAHSAVAARGLLEGVGEIGLRIGQDFTRR